MRVLQENQIPSTFTAAQRAFVEAWFSLTHVESLDSHRVRTLNARLVLRELVEVCHLVEDGVVHPFHREAVAAEAAAVLERDPIYADRFLEDWRVMRSALGNAEYWKGEKASRCVELRVLAEDAHHRLSANYLAQLIEELAIQIAANAGADVVTKLTSSLLTELADKEFSIANLHGFYAFFLSTNPNGTVNTRTFDDRFAYLIKWLNREKVEHEIILKLSNARKLVHLGRFGGWTFNQSVDQVSSDPHETNFVRPGKGVVFALRNVTSRDHREAATEALRSWSCITDQLLFDYISERLPADSRYRSRRTRDDRIDVGSIADRVPNPRERSSPKHLKQFNKDLEIVLSPLCQLRSEDKRQIEAAIRYLRLGTESANLESMFLTRWIALESLLRTVRPDNQIAGVCDGVAQLMSVSFVERMHADLAATAKYLRRSLPPSLHLTADGADSSKLSLNSFAAILRDTPKQTEFISCFGPWPLYSHRVLLHGRAIGEWEELLGLIQKHEKNVRWQVQRSYRVRNEIVHNASHSVPLLSLISHLEYYLRTTLRTVVRLLAQRPHTMSLRDLFHRVSAARTRLEQDLKAKHIPQTLFDPLELA